MTYCPQCGSENDPSARFCLKCGQELATAHKARGISDDRRRARIALGVLLGIVGLAVAGVCAVGGVALFQRYQQELRVRHYIQGIQAVDNREWDVAVSELQQAGDYLDAEEKLRYAEEQLGRLLVLYERGMTHFDAGEYWDAAWWLQQAADMHPDYKDTNESLGHARQQIGKILYVVTDSQGQHLCIMDADGRNQMEVFSVAPQGGDLSAVRISDDATRILVRAAVHDSTMRGTVKNLYSLDLMNGTATQLISGAMSAWGEIAANGNRLLLLVGQEHADDGALYVADFDGGNRHLLATDVVFAHFASFDGDRILVNRLDVESNECVVYFTDAVGQSYKQVMTREGDGFCFGFLSWDLNHMILVEWSQESWALHAADAAGIDMREVTSSETDYLTTFAPWYSLDSESFVFGVESSLDGSKTYFLATADGSEVRALPLETDADMYDLSPTLEYALSVSWGDGTLERGLYMEEVNTGQRTLLSSSFGGWHWQPWEGMPLLHERFSPSGEKVLYPEEMSDGRVALYVGNLDGSGRQLLAYGDRPVWLWPRQ
ncbi:MAG TPA: zinc ribbon domain-containing protein [Anaerolineae bacterium]|nr:zinc ribbon domain-containing protein [Anaerolineae bacterium]